MDPAKLPLELLISIFSYLPTYQTFQLQRVSRSWRTALSSSAAISTASKEVNMDNIKALGLGQPVRRTEMLHGNSDFMIRHQLREDFLMTASYNDMATSTRRAEHHVRISICLQRLADHERPLAVDLPFLIDLRNHDMKRPIVPTAFGEKVVAIWEHKLYWIQYLDGSGKIRGTETPGRKKHYGGPIATSGSTIATLQHTQSDRDDTSLLPNSLWIYDISRGSWNVKEAPAALSQSGWHQGIIIDHGVHIVSIYASHNDDLTGDGVQHGIYVWSSRGTWWTSTYFVKPVSDGPSRCYIEILPDGNNYSITVWTNEGSHRIRISLTEFLGVYERYAVRWHNSIFVADQDRVRTNRHLIKNISRAPESSPLELLVNDKYLIVYGEKGYYHTYIFSFTPMLPHVPGSGLHWRPLRDDIEEVTKEI